MGQGSGGFRARSADHQLSLKPALMLLFTVGWQAARLPRNGEGGQKVPPEDRLDDRLNGFGGR
jgi:hypothetical protein